MKKVSIIIVAIVFVALSLSLFFVIKDYTNQFGTEYSSDSRDWSSFADYLGGVGNTLISLASLIIIGLISILLGRDKNDYKYEQRNQAYDETISYVPKFHVAATAMRHIITIYGKQASWITDDISFMQQNLTTSQEIVVTAQSFTNQRKGITMEFVKEYNEQLIVYYEYWFHLKNFKPRYGGFFKKYKFGKDYEQLIASAQGLTTMFEEYKNILIGDSKGKAADVNVDKVVNIHIEHLTNFVNELLKEIR